MPKVNKKKEKILKWLQELKGHSYKYDGENVLCKKCDKFIKSDRKSQLSQHLMTQMHAGANPAIENVEPGNDDNFCFQLCEAMVSANIPWNVLNNAKLKSFLVRYTEKNIPHESTLRKTYLNKCYERKIQSIREDIGESYLWVSVDETTDASGRYLANLIVGKLTEEESSRPYLIVSQEIAEVYSSSIARFVNNGLRKLWPEGVESKVLLLTTDAAAYMMAAGRSLKTFYPNMIHVTCLAHGVHRIAECIRSLFPTVNKFMSAAKKIFLKAPKRIQAYREMLNIKLPPEPVLTRWGTWLSAAVFYASNFEGVKQVIQSFDSNDAECISVAKESLKEPELFTNLTFIKGNFEGLINILTSLEKRSLPLRKSIQLLEDVKAVIDNIAGDLGLKLKNKFEAVLKRNDGMNAIKEIISVLDDPSCHLENTNEIVMLHASKFEYAPLTSVEVERTFSAYKMIFSDKRQKLKSNSMEKLLVLYCNTDN